MACDSLSSEYEELYNRLHPYRPVQIIRQPLRGGYTKVFSDNTKSRNHTSADLEFEIRQMRTKVK